MRLNICTYVFVFLVRGFFLVFFPTVFFDKTRYESGVLVGLFAGYFRGVSRFLAQFAPCVRHAGPSVGTRALFCQGLWP